MVVHLWVFKFLSELTHVFSGGVNPSSTPFMPPSMPHSSFLTSAAHLGKRLSEKVGASKANVTHAALVAVLQACFIC